MLLTLIISLQWVPQGLVLGPLLYLTFVKNHTSSILSKCYLLVDNVEVIYPSNDIETLPDDLRKTVLWTESWSMSLNLNKCQNLHLGSSVAYTLNMPNCDGNSSGLSQVDVASDLGAITDSKFEWSVRVTRLITKVSRMPNIIHRIFKKLTPEILFSCLLRTDPFELVSFIRRKTGQMENDFTESKLS